MLSIISVLFALCIYACMLNHKIHEKVESLWQADINSKSPTKHINSKALTNSIAVLLSTLRYLVPTLRYLVPTLRYLVHLAVFSMTGIRTTALSLHLS